jgi:PIN domain nuclease of toxin-antitoxin system
MSSLILDTCAALWIANGDDIARDARTAIADSTIHISPISAWEIANLVRKQRITLTMPVVTWFNRATERMQATLLPLSIEALSDSCFLPGAPPADPADRIIIATAREYELTVVTRDAVILNYARAGHVKAMSC